MAWSHKYYEEGVKMGVGEGYTITEFGYITKHNVWFFTACANWNYMQATVPHPHSVVHSASSGGSIIRGVLLIRKGAAEDVGIKIVSFDGINL